MRTLRRSAAVLAAGALVAGAPAAAAWAADGTLPGGTSIEVTIDDPADGSRFVIPVDESTLDVPVVGTAAVGEGQPVKDTTVAYAMDVSGSMAVDAGVNCDEAPGTDSRLVCAQEGVATVNEAAADPFSTVDLTGLASFSDGGSVHDVDLGAAGQQLLVAPGFYGDSNGVPDVEDVAFGLTAAGQTNYAAGLSAAFQVLNSSANTNSINSVIFLSDADNQSFFVGDHVNTLEGSVPGNTTIHAFGLGADTSCTFDGGTGSLNDVAGLSTAGDGDGTCEVVEDLSTLAERIEESRGSTLDSLSLSVDGGTPMAIPNAAISPDLPQDGPASVDYSTVAADLGPGDHELCVTAEGTDAVGSGDVTECVTVTLVQGVEIDIKPGSDPNSINVNNKGVVPVAVLTTDSFDAADVDPSTVCFGDAEAPSERDCSPAHGEDAHQEDVDGDGDVDLLLHFETRETGIDAGDSEACLTGTTTAGTGIEGCDAIRTVPPM